ncbi:MAG: hypothetical protein ACI89T_000039 [Cognaticolwellia sp.]|jgi:hypothetical protein
MKLVLDKEAMFSPEARYLIFLEQSVTGVENKKRSSV